jgi:nucleolar MIF4G domain-containing protein 1
MNTDVRRAIFYALLDSVSYQHAHERILKLNLKNKQMLEIPRVILRCAAAETVYNPFYTLVASEFCKEHRLRKAWEFLLLDIFRRMGEDRDGDGYESMDDDEDENDNEEKLSVREAYNLAKLYGQLVSEGLLRVTVLKTLDLASPKGLKATTTVFVQVLITAVLLALKSASKKAGNNDVDAQGAFEREVRAAFAHAHAQPELPVALRQWIARTMTKKDVASTTKSKRERRVVVDGLGYALEALKEPVVGNLDEGLSSDEEDLSGDGM